MVTSGRAKERARLLEGAERSCRRKWSDTCIEFEFDWDGTSVKV